MSPPPPGDSFGLEQPSLEIWRRPQCVIVSDHSIFYNDQPIWLDAIYIRMRPNRGHMTWTGIAADYDAQVYATNLTFQSQPGVNFTAMLVFDGGKILCQGEFLECA